MEYNLSDIVKDTVTNSEGSKLFAVLDDAIKDKKTIKLNFTGTTAMSSSFLNSSIGELIEKYSFETFKQFVKLVDLKQSIAKQLKDYLASCGLQVY